MYISKIVLEDVRCFGDGCHIDLGDPRGPKKCTVVLGDNGVGKTTLLRCIALGLCDESSAGGLLQDIPGDWIRKGAKKARIAIHLVKGKNRFRITTTVTRSRTGFEVVRQTTTPSVKFPWKSTTVPL